jgi:hypothetical protein
MDGDSRGGAALSVREVSGAPIKFLGTGEKMDSLEPFYPERMAQRILGMGDMLTLYEKAQDAIKVGWSGSICAAGGGVVGGARERVWGEDGGRRYLEKRACRGACKGVCTQVHVW